MSAAVMPSDFVFPVRIFSTPPFSLSVLSSSICITILISFVQPSDPPSSSSASESNILYLSVFDGATLADIHGFYMMDTHTNTHLAVGKKKAVREKRKFFIVILYCRQSYTVEILVNFEFLFGVIKIDLSPQESETGRVSECEREREREREFQNLEKKLVSWRFRFFFIEHREREREIDRFSEIFDEREKRSSSAKKRRRTERVNPILSIKRQFEKILYNVRTCTSYNRCYGIE